MIMATSKENQLTIGGVDIDTWLDQEKTASRHIEGLPELKYDKKIVAFLDLLGITEQVMNKTRGKESEIISTMEMIKEIVEKEVKGIHTQNEIIMLCISDSFIFACEKEDLPQFLRLLSNIQMRILIECKTMLRGAVEYGDVIIRDFGKQIIGPAYITAYINQEKHAIYPRIILGQSVVDLISSYDKTIVSRDREYSLDYLDVYMELDGKSKKAMETKLIREGVIDYLLENYQEFSSKGKLSIKAKYAWTINYIKEKEVWPDAKKYHCW